MRNLHAPSPFRSPLVRVIVIFAFLSTALLSAPVEAQEKAAESTAEKRGDFNIKFTQRSPLSGIDTQLRRMRVKARNPQKDYQLTEESFEVYVPKDYKPDGSYGVFVWISAGNGAKCPGQFKSVLDKHKLIFIGANKAGNSRALLQRFGLALDAAHYVREQYKIDKRRIYVSGISGGGRTSCLLGFLYPDVFSGTFAIVGAEFYRKIKVPDQNKYWSVHILPPTPRQLKYLKQVNRFVLLTGEKDSNRVETKEIYNQGFKVDRYRFATYLEVPGMGHTLPPTEWFEKGIVFLDSGLSASGADPAGSNPVMARKEKIASEQYDRVMKLIDRDPRKAYLTLRRIAVSFKGTPTAAKAAAQVKRLENDPKIKSKLKTVPPPPPTAGKALEWLKLARNYITADRPDLARAQLKKILDQYPDSDEAKEAKKLIKDLAGK